MSAIAPRIRRIGTRDFVNSYLVEESGEVTIVDAGASGHWRELPGELAAMDRTLEDVRAIVLTHGHSDHIGFAERGRTERGWPVLVHQLDAAMARGDVRQAGRVTGSIRPLPLLRFLTWAALKGMVRVTHVGVVGTFGDGATLDVPGAPRVVLAPGHTAGSAALHFAGHDALLVGDVIATYGVTSGRPGPQLSPFSEDPAQALTSLSRLEPVDARHVLPGHGPAFVGSPAEAVARARAQAMRTGR
jgi:glyoxylase-like metal-dependent hydrolase (beta-lactamase superfamily II)